jgi:D-aminopeptidase
LFTLALAVALCLGLPARAQLPFKVGLLPSGPLDGITDVAGVRVAHLTKIEGDTIRTGATVVMPDADPWNHKPAAATVAFNGNGEMTGTHWIEESGYLEEPIVLTNTLDVGRAHDGVVSWVLRHYPRVGVSDDVPLPVVAECDDAALNDIRARAVTAEEVSALIDRAAPGQFARGNVGAGTGMKAFGFKAGIGSASRVLPASLGGYTVGVLVNDNTGSRRNQLTIAGVPVGQRLQDVDLPVFPKRVSLHGRMAAGSIIVVVATDAPLDSRQLRALALRAAMGMGRTGLSSDIGSGDLFIAFSTSFVYTRNADFDISAPAKATLESDGALNALYEGTAEATQSAIYNALFSAKTMTGYRGITFYALPQDRVLEMLRAAGVTMRS